MSGPAAIFQALLKKRESAPPAEREAIDREIEERFGTERTILIADMARFSYRTVAEGIIPVLMSIYRMRRRGRDVVKTDGGYLFKVDADNLLAAFFDTASAIKAAVDLQNATSREPPSTPEGALALCIGIARGHVLAIGENEVYGQAVNTAAKLGEDIARAGEVLVMDEIAIEGTALDGHPFERLETAIGGLRIPYRRFAFLAER